MRGVLADGQVFNCLVRWSNSQIEKRYKSVGEIHIANNDSGYSSVMKENQDEGNRSRKETCMAFSSFAETFIEFSKGRQISKPEALEILRKNEEDGLVFQPSNTQFAEFICSCCGCCCGMLSLQKSLPQPLNHWTSNYFAEVDPDICSGCETCIDVCQVTAMKFNEDDRVSFIDLNRCIGCGNCVPACPDGAIALLNRESEVIPPKDHDALQEVIMGDK